MRTRKPNDKGFSLIELLVVVIIIGVLAAIAIPVFQNQKAKAYNASVQADLKTFATAAETFVADKGSYPAVEADWRAGGVVISKGNHLRIFVNTDTANGQAPGFIIYGTNENTSDVWVLSSFTKSAPERVPGSTFTASNTPGGNLDNALGAAFDDGKGGWPGIATWQNQAPLDLNA